MKIPIRKKWGQNFLIDPNIIRKIISVLNPDKNQTILEIGPGKGALTKILSKMNLDLHAVEIDPMLCDYLKEEKINNVKIYNEDILKFDCSKIPENYMIIGNLPYNISTPILFKFMEELKWNKMVVMLQKEVAERIVSNHGNKKYGKISIMMQSFFDVNLEFNIPNTVFNPQPKVTSSLLLIKPKKIKNTEYKKLKIIVENAFKHRRKKLARNLKNIIEDEQYNEIKDKRAEQLSVADYQKLSHYIIDYV
ncbi:16S rRNA (adenine(1518)-N(6)/adenine(1519)-N(6))-dimethyltransferase RsmA [bacterium]|nr:16S rRNA (adenine(1518)-N(6)/adenine(1519)-N(6))-dimethyltransferase RsmA [bacterium]